jgi:hypothetical protein
MPLLVDSTQEAGIPIYDPATRLSGGYIDAASFTCHNCGFIRLHALDALEGGREPHGGED